MAELGEYWRDVSPILKEQAREKRESQFDKRLQYAINQFEQHQIPYKLCNKDIGHFNLYYKGKVIISFWSYTGKIRGQENRRGISSCINFYKKKIKELEEKEND